MKQKDDILILIDDLPEKEYDHLKEYLLFLKHKNELIPLIEDRKEELLLQNYALRHIYSDSIKEDDVYDNL